MLFRKLLFFAPLALMVVVLNFCVDPSRVFTSAGYSRALAGVLLSGQHASNVWDYDDRLLQKEYVAGLKSGRDVIVLGSSRAMQMGSDFFPGETFFNHAVAGATIEDDIAIYGLYAHKKLIPRRVVLFIDPWVFNARNDQTRWCSLAGEYEQMRLLLGIAGNERWRPWWHQGQKLQTLISLTYFHDSGKRLLERLRGKSNMFSVTDSSLGDLPAKLKDGVLRYGADMRARTEAEIDQEAVKYSQEKEIYSLGNFNELSFVLQDKFERLIRRIRQDGATVELLMVPYHPIVWNVLAHDPKYRLVAAAEAYVNDFARREGITVHGSYDPGRYGLGSGDFYDGMHAQASVITRIIR